MKNNPKALMSLVIFILASLTSCASTPNTWSVSKPDWNPPQGEEYAVAQCKVQANSVSTNLIGSINPFFVDTQKRAAFKECMSAYGYSPK